MEVNQNRLAQAIDEDFKTSNREELEAFAGTLGVDFHPNIGDEKLRARMLESLGKKVTEVSGDEHVSPNSSSTPSGVLTADQLIKLNLTPNGAWQGRRRRLSIVRPDYYKGHRPQCFRWGQLMVMIPWNKPVSVPWPIYEIIKNSEHIEVQDSTDYDRKTGRSNWRTSMVNRWNFTDLGDDPETVNLPRGQKEQFRMIADQRDLFRDYSKYDLTRLCRRLRVRYERGSDAPELREIVLRKLGYDVDLMEELVA